jgi:hypothetical protein
MSKPNPVKHAIVPTPATGFGTYAVIDTHTGQEVERCATFDAAKVAQAKRDAADAARDF